MGQKENILYFVKDILCLAAPWRIAFTAMIRVAPSERSDPPKMKKAWKLRELTHEGLHTGRMNLVKNLIILPYPVKVCKRSGVDQTKNSMINRQSGANAENSNTRNQRCYISHIAVPIRVFTISSLRER